MKQPIRAFSVGLFTSGIIFLLVFILFGVNKEETSPPDDEMIADLEDKGYHVLSDSEYVSLSVENDENDESEDESEENNENDSEENDDNNNDSDDNNDDNEANNDNDDDENDDSDDNETYELTIDEGMASSDISSKLEEHDIIDDESDFNDFLQEEDYHQQVQLGSFDVSDDMDFEEIAEAITN